MTVCFEGLDAGVEFYLDDVNMRQMLVLAVHSSNLASNGDFEKGIAGWTVWGGALSSVASYKVNGLMHSSRWERGRGLSRVVAVEEYGASVWVKVSGSSTDNTKIYRKNRV